VPGLGTSFGRGGATTFPQDLVNSDCILIIGSNMAEAHPIAFSAVVQARERGAPVFHVDPRFSRTSALASTYIPIRSGSDIALLGGLINYVLTTVSYFREYVVAYTNAATLIDEKYADTEDLDGLFSGYDPETRTYDSTSWQYARTPGRPDPNSLPEREGTGAAIPSVRDSRSESSFTEAERDETLQHPRCVFQILRRHFARYSPELVEEVCGTPREQFLELANALVANSGRERTTALCYAVGWTQHTKGAQTIRAAAILQLLLGNIGRPGGGIMALRGHASIQGSTDVPTLYDLLSGYMPQPTALIPQQTLAAYVAASGFRTGYWANFSKFIVSLLKAWYGDAATADNDFCYAHLPKTIGDHSHLATTYDMADGKIKGLIVLGQNPAAGSSHARLQRQALGRLEWLVVRDLYETETAAFWKSPADKVDPSSIETEVFFLPAAGPGEKAGSFTNTQRLIQWKDKAVDPPDDARSDAWFIHWLAKRLKSHYAESRETRDRAIQDLDWEFDQKEPEPGSRITDEPDVERVLMELNGFTYADRKQVPDFSALRDDGSTACGSWIYSGVYPAEGVNRAASRKTSGGLFSEWGFAWPANRRILYNRASSDPDGHPWSERKKLVWWDSGESRWTGLDVPDFPATKPPTSPARPELGGMDALSGSDPFIMRPDGKAWLFAPVGLKDGPLPCHYEPAESPVGNRVYRGQQDSPVARLYQNRRDNPLAAVNDERFPIVLTTYRLTEHHVSGPMTRWLPWLNALQPELFVEISPELARERGIRHRDWVTIASARATIEARAMVTRRVRPFKLGDRIVHQVGLPFHWGYQGDVVGAVTNDLTHLALEPTVSINEVKAILVDVRPGKPRG
jgi:formate dehydrogenase major subunit